MRGKCTLPSTSHWGPAMSPMGVQILPSLCQSQVRRKHITSCNYKMLGEKKRKGKRAAISVARHENKPTEKSALMSRVYAAGCVGWILPHPRQGRG